jgi:membrane protein implicated in regulation of membrane protease activity
MDMLAFAYIVALIVNISSAYGWWRVTQQLKAERDKVLQQGLRYVETQAQIERVLADVEAADRWLEGETLRALTMQRYVSVRKEQMH